MKPLPPRASAAWDQAALHFHIELPRQLIRLEFATQGLLESLWDEPLRLKAYEMAAEIADQSSQFGFNDLTSVLRAVCSLLRLPLEEVIPLQGALKDKLHELFLLLHTILDESVDRRTA